MSASADAAAFVERALGDVLDAFPPEIRAMLVTKFCDEYAAPMTREMELALHKRLTDDEVRHLMFCPMPAQYRHFATLLSLRGPAASDSSAPSWPRVLHKRFLTLFYLKHARNWPLVTEFVLLDGLQVLADQFVHADLQVRGQAIDCFVQITSSASFDWFDDPVGYEARVLHSKMLALAAPRAQFLSSLVRNIRSYETPDSGASGAETTRIERLPGGTFVLLQVLAFFLSWLRKFYAKDSELRLSRELLELLHDWRNRTRTQEAAELELAQQVYDDFSRWPALESERDASLSECETSATAHCGVSTSASLISSGATDSTPSRASETVFSRDHIQRLLDAGNSTQTETQCEAKETRAIQLCSDAIAANACLVDAHLLRARALTQEIERLASRSSSPPVGGVSKAQRDCTRVLALDATNIEARKYRVRVLRALAMWDKALEALDEWVASDADALAHTFLTDDIAFFRAQHVEVLEQQRHEAHQQRLDAIKLEKQEAIYQAILQRDATIGSACPQHYETPEARAPRSLKQETELTKTSVSVDSAAALSDQLQAPRALLKGAKAPGASLKSSQCQPPKKRTVDAETEALRQTRAFARAFTRTRTDACDLAALLLGTPSSVLASAVETALSDDHIFALVAALMALEQSADPSVVRSASARRRPLTGSRRFQFALAMAPDDVRSRFDCVLGAESSAADAPSSAEDEPAASSSVMCA